MYAIDWLFIITAKGKPGDNELRFQLKPGDPCPCIRPSQPCLYQLTWELQGKTVSQKNPIIPSNFTFSSLWLASLHSRGWESLMGKGQEAKDSLKCTSFNHIKNSINSLRTCLPFSKHVASEHVSY